MTNKQLLRALRRLVEEVDAGSIKLDRLHLEFGILAKRVENSANIPEGGPYHARQ